jgi:hypothetical protein
MASIGSPFGKNTAAGPGFYQTGVGTAQGFRYKKAPNTSVRQEAPLEPPEPHRYTHTPLYLEGIKRGETGTLVIPTGKIFGPDAEVVPEKLVIVEGRGLWLLSSSGIRGWGFHHEDLPLETFMSGCPHEISWRKISAYQDGGMDVVLHIENRCPARNSSGRLVGRLSSRILTPPPF